jgi:polyisoprenoid-binding protein YceI
LKAALVLLGLATIPFAQDGPYQSLNGPSTLTYTLVHPMHVIQGVSHGVTCKVSINNDTAKSEIACSAPLLSFESGNDSRDSHMLEVVEALRYPEVQFSGHPTGHAPGSSKDIGNTGHGDAWLVTGTLKFHGYTHPVVFTVAPSFSEGRVRMVGAFPISLTEFHIKRPSLLFVPVEDTVRIAIDVTAKFP